MSSFTTVVSDVEAVAIVRKLPREISLYIYREFLETECKYEIIMREFRSERVQRLKTIYLCDLMNQASHVIPRNHPLYRPKIPGYLMVRAPWVLLL